MIASPTLALGSVLIKSIINAIEGRDVTMTDLTGAYLSMENKETVLIALCGWLAELMMLRAPNIYQKFISTDWNGTNVPYVCLAMVLYGLLQSTLLLYHKL